MGCNLISIFCQYSNSNSNPTDSFSNWTCTNRDYHSIDAQSVEYYDTPNQ